MIENVSVEYEESEDEYYLVLDGEKHGPVDSGSLSELADDLYMHFRFFKNAAAYQESDNSEVENEVSSEELDEELQSIQEEIEDQFDDE